MKRYQDPIPSCLQRCAIVLAVCALNFLSLPAGAGDEGAGVVAPTQAKTNPEPAKAAPAQPARQPGQREFAGISKADVLQLQDKLEAIYKDLPEWKRDYAMVGEPLDDGIVGPVTLSWLRRFSFNFKLTAAMEDRAAIKSALARIAAFSAKYPAELGILVSPAFETWDNGQDAAVREQDFETRRSGADADLFALVNRFRAGRKATPASGQGRAQPPGYYTYVLQQPDLDMLGGKDPAAKILATLKDRQFGSLDELKAALLQALGARDYLLQTFWPVVEKNTPAFDGYLLDEAAISRMRKEKAIASDSLDVLHTYGTVYLKSREALDAFIEQKSAAGEILLAEEETAALAKATQAFDNFHLDQQALDTIGNTLKGDAQASGLPPPVIHMLEQMKDVDYPELSVFRTAVASKIAMGLGMCRMNSPSNNKYIRDLRLLDDDVALLRKGLEALHPRAGTDARGLDQEFELIGRYRAMARICEEQDNAASKAVALRLYDQYLGVAIENAARKKIPDEIVPLKVEGTDCGCALDDTSGLIYAFYPYWKNDKKPRAINFRMLNRVAYYGLSADNAGNFHLGGRAFDLTDGSTGANHFVRAAHQHSSEVDWTIQKNDWDGEWRNYSKETRQGVFRRMQSNIVTLLTAPLTDPVSRMKPFTSLGLGERARRGDGVTLYFPGYPTDGESTRLFNEFYASLRTELAKNGLWLNMLVSQDALSAGKNGGGGAFGLSNLISLRKKQAAGDIRKRAAWPAHYEFILVLLDEPSPDAKRMLRADIENESGLHGTARADFIRSVLPILHFDNRNWQQLEDDIVYARDNFGGIGFWSPDLDNLSQPVVDVGQSCLQSRQIAVCLMKNYRDESLSQTLPGTVERFACVHRWLLQLILTLLLVVAIGVVVLYFRSCNAQNFIKRHFLWMLALVVIPAVVCFTLLLLYDPLLDDLSQGNVPFIVASALIVLGLIFGYRYLRAQRRVPVRERGLPQREGLGFPIIAWNIESSQQGFQWVVRNRGTGYAIIRKVEILLDRQPVADVKSALDSVLEADNRIVWKSVPLVGQKLQPGESLVALSVNDSTAASIIADKLSAHKLEVHIVYGAASGEHWVSDGKEIRSISDL